MPLISSVSQTRLRRSLARLDGSLRLAGVVSYLNQFCLCVLQQRFNIAELLLGLLYLILRAHMCPVHSRLKGIELSRQLRLRLLDGIDDVCELIRHILHLIGINLQDCHAEILLANPETDNTSQRKARGEVMRFLHMSKYNTAC